MLPIPIPSSHTPPDRKSILVAVDDYRATIALIDELLERAGLTQAEVARRLGITKQGVHQYRSLRRARPSVQWMAKLAQVCGGRLVVEFPPTPLIPPGEPGSPDYRPGPPNGPRPDKPWVFSDSTR